MSMNEITDINPILEDIDNLVKPAKLILFHRKMGSCGQTLSFKICLITNAKNKLEIEKNIYKYIDSEIPFDVILYTCDEWECLKIRKNSFASKILQRGYFIYGKE